MSKGRFSIALVLMLLLALVASQIATATPLAADKYGVCHVDGKKTFPFLEFNYVEVGGLSGHFYGGNPDLPRHGAFGWNGTWGWWWDFVTVLGDLNCDGVVDYIPCSEQVAGTAPATEYGTWSAWAYNAGLDLWERFRDVTTYSVPMLDARDGSVCVPAVPTVMTERETRAPVITHETYAQDDCQGWVVLEQRYKDGIADGNPVALLSGQWADPYALEQATPAGTDTDGHAFAFTIDEDRECLQQHEYRTTFLYGYGTSPEEDPDCSGWWGIMRLFRDEVVVDTDYQAGLWADPFTLESVTADFSVTDGEFTDTESQTFYEPEECLQEHETGPWYTESCKGYEYGYVLDGKHIKTGEGEWQDSFKAEEVTVQVYVPETQETFSIYIGKEEECLECKWTALYPMSIYEPDNPPQSYWHGPFDFHACAVIHDWDEVPSADRVTMVCSMCPDQIEGGFIFNAIHKPYTGYLYEVECYGKKTTYVFADDWHEFEWDEDWVRDGYTNDGHRCEDNPRIAGCSAWIHEQAGIPYWEPTDSE